jgi:hypothetical protein
MSGWVVKEADSYNQMDDHARLHYLDRIHAKVELCNLNDQVVPVELAGLIMAISMVEGVSIDSGISESAAVFRIQNRLLRRLQPQSYDSDPDPDDPDE